MPALTINARVLTKPIGDELVRLIDTDASVASTIDPKVVQFGRQIRQATIEHLKTVVPAIIVKPDEVDYIPKDASGTDYDVFERYRICYLYPFDDNTVVVPDRGSDHLDLIVLALRTDHKLSTIQTSIQDDGGKHQIAWSEPRGVEWEPEEDILFLEAGVAIKCDVLRWEVKWLAR